MTTKTITIGPEKFTIFDSDVSDSESEADEWVSVSTSTTVSTTSTLPPHLNLNPRSAIKVRPLPNPGVSQPHNSRASTPPASTPPASPPPPAPPAPPLPPTTILARTPTTPTQPPTPRAPPITILKRFFPTLTAIYIVSPTSIFPPKIHEPQTSTVHIPLSTLTSFRPNPPISTKVTRPGINLSETNLEETYIRICADCAKPPMTIYCNGTWTSSASPLSAVTRSPCPVHFPAFQIELSRAFPTSQSDAGGLTCGRCTQMASIISCLDCAKRRDKTLFHAALDAVSPFRRAETQSLGVGVFDMSVPVSGEVYRHVEGCGCVR